MESVPGVDSRLLVCSEFAASDPGWLVDLGTLGVEDLACKGTFGMGLVLDVTSGWISARSRRCFSFRLHLA